MQKIRINIYIANEITLYHDKTGEKQAEAAECEG